MLYLWINYQSFVLSLLELVIQLLNPIFRNLFNPHLLCCNLKIIILNSSVIFSHLILLLLSPNCSRHRSFYLFRLNSRCIVTSKLKLFYWIYGWSESRSFHLNCFLLFLLSFSVSIEVAFLVFSCLYVLISVFLS
jgi:hypothetical protein